MLEVPTHKNVNSLDRRRCDVSSILQMSSAYHSSAEILPGEIRGFCVERHFFQHVLRD